MYTHIYMHARARTYARTHNLMSSQIRERYYAALKLITYAFFFVYVSQMTIELQGYAMIYIKISLYKRTYPVDS